MRSVQRASLAFLGAGQVGVPRRRDVALGQGERRLGQGQRPLGADPREGDDPVPRVRRAMDGHPAAALAVVGAQPADPGDDRRDRIGPVAGRDRRAEVDQRVAAGVALAVPGPPPADGDLELDHRLEPVDVGPFEQAGLDQSHGPGRIARCQRPRLRAMTAPTDAAARRPPPPSSTRCAPPSPPTCRPTSPTSSASSTSTAGATRPAGVDEVGRWVAAFLDGARRRRSRPGPTRPAASGRRSSPRSAAGPRRRASLLIGHMDTVFDPGTAAERPFRIDDGIAYGPGVTDMKSGLLAGLYALKAIIAERGGLPFERLMFIANPDEEIGSPTSTPHIRERRRRQRRRARARVRPRQRRHRVGAQGHPRPADRPSTAGPPTPASSPRRAAARSSRRPGSSRPARAQRPLAGRDGQRRGDRRRDAAQRRRRALLARGRRPRATDARGARDRRGRDPADRRGDRGPGHDRRVRRRWRAGGRWRSSSAAAGSSSTPRPSPARSASRSPTPRPAARPTPTRRPGWASRASTASGRSAATTTRPAEYLEVDSIVPRTTLLAGLLLAIAADPEVLAWRAEPRRAGGGRRRVVTERRRISSGGPWEAVAGLQPGDRRRRRRAGSPARPTPGPTAGRAIRATSPPRRGRPSRSSRRRSPRRASRSPTSSGPGCS